MDAKRKPERVRKAPKLTKPKLKAGKSLPKPKISTKKPTDTESRLYKALHPKDKPTVRKQRKTTGQPKSRTPNPRSNNRK